LHSFKNCRTFAPESFEVMFDPTDKQTFRELLSRGAVHLLCEPGQFLASCAR